MPTIRYQIRNEYGLASSELYQAADRDDPEAILEGVAMAGLVGVLRQLGDLSEFAAEIFHDLHEEVMATAARGHGMMLRVQQLEAEFPSIEKALLSQTNQTGFAQNTGVDWHANLQCNQNLITGGDMPRFILDSYEECRGPPRLFTLDKFDIAGAGACLKRYSDPSFFKTNSVSSDKIEKEVQIEKKSRKIKKKGPRLRNGATLESLLSPRKNANSQLVNSAEVSETIPIRRVKLKHRNLNDPTSGSGKSYMENFIEVHLPEEKGFKNSKSHNHVMKKSFDSSESVPEENEVFIDNSVKSPSFKGKTPTQLPFEQKVIVVPANKLDNHDEDLFESLSEPVCEVQSEKKAFAEIENKLFRSANGSHPSELEKSLPPVQVLDQNQLSIDAEFGENGHPDGYMSDDVTSEMEKYMDALNTMESELETDSESKARRMAGQLNLEQQLVNCNEEVLELQCHSLGRDSTQNSTVSLADFVNRSAPSTSDLDTVDNMSDSQPPQDMVDSDMPTSSVVYPDEILEASAEAIYRNVEDVEHETSENIVSDEIYDAVGSNITNVRLETTEASASSCIITETISRNVEDMEQGTPENIVSDEVYDFLGSDMMNVRSEIAEASASSCVTDLTTTHQLAPLESTNEEAQSVILDQIKLPSGYAKDTFEVPEHLHDNLSSTTENIELPSQLTTEIGPPELPEKSEILLDAPLGENDITNSILEGTESPKIIDHTTSAKEQTSEVTAAIFDKSDHLSQTHGNVLDEDSLSWLGKPLSPSTFPTEEPEKIPEIDEADTQFDASTTVAAFNQDHSSTGVQPEYLLAGMESVGPVEDLACSLSILVPKDADDNAEGNSQPANVLPAELDSLSDPAEHQSSNIINSEVLKSLFPNEGTPQNFSSDCEKNNVSADSEDMKPLFGCDGLIVEADSDTHDPLTFSSEETDFRAESQEDYVAEEAVPNQSKVSINELSDPKDLTALDSETTRNVLPCFEVEDQQLPAPTISTSEFFVEDSFTAIGEPLDGVCHSLLSGDAQTDLNSFNDDEIHSPRNVDLSSMLGSDEFMKEDLSTVNFLSGPAISVEASKVEDASEANVMYSQEGGEHHQQCDTLLESGAVVEQSDGDPKQELDSSATVSRDNDCESALPISNIEDSTPVCSSEVPPTCLGFDASAAAPLFPHSIGLVPSETTPKFAGTYLGEPVSIFPSEGIANTPPLPPLPPLQWRMGKPQYFSKSDGKTEQTFMRQNPFSDLATEDKKHPNCSENANIEMFQLDNLFATFPPIGSDNIQHGSMASVGKGVHPLRLVDLPPIADDARHPESSYDVVGEGMPKPSESFSVLPAVEEEGLFQHLPSLQAERSQVSELSGRQPTLDDERSRLDQLLPRVDTDSGHQSTITNERNVIQSPDTFLEMPTIDDDVRHFSYGVYGSENMQLMQLSMPQQFGEPKLSQHDFLYLHGNSYVQYGVTFPAIEDEKPNGKLSSIRARPRDPLIEAVASHDKSTLRKVSEMVQPSTKPKEDDRNSLLDQIKNKSFNLKPTVVTKPSMKGPATNIKVAAILEKANAIRQAFVGSDDDDDDGDSWSDS
ncbi:SCAR-like protein 1 [Dioscorea cayenensis subsp. rotundata]|uniref:Protein SCAR n=1 Tax=Dioscorea cayennensis subsp. rotundata TaxID=55577 RepID=A0AB40AKG0_DIOCR|nr:SCAR-like protein 1 [Dioscorea cayenensis subsp. rotundata]